MANNSERRCKRCKKVVMRLVGDNPETAKGIRVRRCILTSGGYLCENCSEPDIAVPVLLCYECSRELEDTGLAKQGRTSTRRHKCHKCGESRIVTEYFMKSKERRNPVERTQVR